MDIADVLKRRGFPVDVAGTSAQSQRSLIVVTMLVSPSRWAMKLRLSREWMLRRRSDHGGGIQRVPLRSSPGLEVPALLGMKPACRVERVCFPHGVRIAHDPVKVKTLAACSTPSLSPCCARVSISA